MSRTRSESEMYDLVCYLWLIIEGINPIATQDTHIRHSTIRLTQHNAPLFQRQTACMFYLALEPRDALSILKIIHRVV